MNKKIIYAATFMAILLHATSQASSHQTLEELHKFTTTFSSLQDKAVAVGKTENFEEALSGLNNAKNRCIGEANKTTGKKRKNDEFIRPAINVAKRVKSSIETPWHHTSPSEEAFLLGEGQWIKRAMSHMTEQQFNKVYVTVLHEMKKANKPS